MLKSQKLEIELRELSYLNPPVYLQGTSKKDLTNIKIDDLDLYGYGWAVSHNAINLFDKRYGTVEVLIFKIREKTLVLNFSTSYVFRITNYVKSKLEIHEDFAIYGNKFTIQKLLLDIGIDTYTWKELEKV